MEGSLAWHRENRQQRWRSWSRFFNLLWALVKRDVTARYRRSVLGPAWAILQPLVLMVLFTMLRSFVDISSEGAPYALFSYAALVPWTFFTNAVSLSGPSVRSNGAVIKKIALPREVFPLAAVVTALFDFTMSGLVLAGMMVWFKVSVSWSLLWLPVLVLLTAALAFGVGMFIASLGTFKRDFIFATPFLMQFWLYARPVIYRLSSVPDRWRGLYTLNPMVGVIEGFRAALLGTRGMPWDLLAVGTGSALVIFITGALYFKRMERIFADVA